MQHCVMTDKADSLFFFADKADCSLNRLCYSVDTSDSDTDLQLVVFTDPDS